MSALQSGRNDGSILGAETVRKFAHGQIARIRCVRVIFDVAPALVRTVRAIYGTVAKVLVRKAGAVAATELRSLLALGGIQQGFGDAGLWKKGGKLVK